MKVFYLNDERKEVVVRVMDARWDPVTFTGDRFITLKACEAREFEVEVPEGAILYVKKWPSMIMFSFYYPQNTDQKPVEQPRSPQLEGSS